MPDSLTLTVYTVQFSKGTETTPVATNPDAYRFRFATADAAQSYAERFAPSWGEPTITEKSTTYRVGDRVKVSAYGRTRPGRVTELGKSRVTVDFQRNASGQRGQRVFTALEIEPAEQRLRDANTSDPLNSHGVHEGPTQRLT